MAYLRLLRGSEVADGRFRTCLVETERLKIYRSELVAYTKIGLDDHPEEQFGYICQGAMALEMNGENHLLYEGDSYFVPAHVPHTLTALYDSTLLKVMIVPRSKTSPPDA